MKDRLKAIKPAKTKFLGERKAPKLLFRTTWALAAPWSCRG